MNESDLMFTVIEGMCEACVLPTLPTLCVRTGHTKEELLPLLAQLKKEGKIEWINEEIVISLPKPEWYLDYLLSLQKIKVLP
ncbi:hypothetical protein AJ85_00490 [Alkalihalobacillus alcalophilus ATCC 27647 = CGMCC 1.3604]|uniref:Uncharacterized protein n=1 Tax=Alkalihalobacillus alcalophilus ATCC 27647 = CGMCC 1.3604 TaxID=1218173 RepID=A0A094WDK7_ALKAL|nr:hypothetical protein [Alkalihalobacillus alcalophilus]KGA95829.1 hypothetical protein BALCAV_0220055 [Alkalihalobacillus alcalophilus ATCC 27647 = CGMCC 1.3604]MED1562948.1 hypothetical protein [Alkalihalobacillus alcalophilus]THG91959.1 hypothetical protein AJ85_00490 [Alkalihalobacillus alcalophilus ATCC 27647 = CGMCC 1.3604]